MLSFRYVFRAAVIAALAVAVVFACGPFFGIEVLRSRGEVLLSPPSISFESELRALAPAPQDKLPVVEPDESDSYYKFSSSQVTAPAPDPVPLYAAGALAFHSGDIETARADFEQVVDLPEQDRKAAELRARFMLGRIAVQNSNQPEAAAQFEAVRNLVRHGTPDPLGLAVSSFGEQAHGAWRQHDVARAVDLYARQASYGSASGANSLVMIARQIFADPSLLDQGIQDPLTRRLLFICLNHNSGRPFFSGYDVDPPIPTKVDTVVALLQSHGINQVEGAGLLASAAYSRGNFDLAQKLAALEDVPISSWVKAKLALRNGDIDTALKDYQRAIKTFQPAMGDPTSLKMEYGVLRVNHQDYIQALDLFYAAAAQQWAPQTQFDGFADYWGDAAYLAERVLTVDELRNYIDHSLPPLPSSQALAQSERSRFRSILARRLMRAGHRSEAIRYFDDPKVRSQAEQYISALNTASAWWHLPSTRAEAWYTAAKLARYQGMELLGFELEPDFAIYDGEFDGGYGPDLPTPIWPNQKSAVANLSKSADEIKRVIASKPAPNVRFQYRLTGVDEAMKSADFLPPRSQPFAAVLCNSTGWIIDREPERAHQVYERYLHQGAYVPWGRHFGRTCPVPNFAEVGLWGTASRQATRLSIHAHAHPLYAALPVVLLFAIGAALVLYLRARSRRRSS